MISIFSSLIKHSSDSSNWLSIFSSNKMFGRPKVNDLNPENLEPISVGIKPYEQRMAPRNDRVDTGEVTHNMENGEMAEYIRKMPRANNPAQGMGQAGSVYLNSALKQPTGIGRGLMAREPFYHPPGGFTFEWKNARLPMDYYAQQPRPKVAFEFPAETPFEDINHPLSANQRALTNRVATTVTPSAVYNLSQRVESSLTVKPSVTFKPYSAMEGSVAPTEESTSTRVRTIKYVHDRDLITLLTPVHKTVISDGEITIPLKLKDPMAVAMAAAAHSVIEIPFQGKTIKLKDYTWTVRQASMTSPVELVIESKTKLKDKYDLNVTMDATAVSNLHKYAHNELALLENKLPEVILADIPVSNLTENLAYGDPSYGIKNRYHYSATPTMWNIPAANNLPPVQGLFESKRKLAAQVDPVMVNPYGPPLLY